MEEHVKKGSDEEGSETDRKSVENKDKRENGVQKRALRVVVTRRGRKAAEKRHRRRSVRSRRSSRITPRFL